MPTDRITTSTPSEQTGVRYEIVPTFAGLWKVLEVIMGETTWECPNDHHTRAAAQECADKAASPEADAPTPPRTDGQQGCPFCQRIQAGDVALGNMWAVGFAPLNPVTPGHFLVVSRDHLLNASISPRTTGRVMEFACQIAQGLHDDCNIITSVGKHATQTIGHLHIHLVPRRPNDGLALPWTVAHQGEPS